MSYPDSPIAEDASPTSKASSSGSSVFGNIPSVEVEAKQLRKLTVPQRIGFIAKTLYKSEGSGFLKGAIVHRLLDYAMGSCSKQSHVTRLWSDTLHGLIRCFEFDSVVNGVVRVAQEDENQDNFDKYRIENLTSQAFRKNFLPENAKADHATWTDSDGPSGNSVSMPDIIHFLFNADPTVAEKYSFTSVHREEFDHNNRKCYFTVFQMSNKTLGLSARSLSDSQYSSKIYRVYAEGRCDYNDVRDLLTLLGEIARENFIKVVKPEKNMLEMREHNISIIPRQVTYDMVRNLPIDEIKHSVQYYLRNRRRRVIAIIGDPGLGKTKAVYNIVNAFPQTPAFVVSASALGQWGDVEAVRSIFSAVSSLESILIMDDFDGFDLGDKDAITNEFLLQLAGERGFNGIAILIINDPSRVNYTLMSRAGRIDEVHEMAYLTDIAHVREAVQANFLDSDLSGCEQVFQYMITHHMDTARIVGSAEYAMSHNNGIDPTTLQIGAEKMLLFRENSKKVSVRGKLQVDTGYVAKKPKWLQDLQNKADPIMFEESRPRVKPRARKRRKL